MTLLNQDWVVRRASLREGQVRLIACWAGLTALTATRSAWAQFLPLEPAQVVINPDGGNNSDDGLRIYLGNRGGLQVVRSGAGQYYGDVPTGPEGVNNGFFMAVGTPGQAVVYGPQLDIQWAAIAWTDVSQSEVTGEGTTEAPYQVVTVVSAGGFRLGQTVRYVVPQVYFDVRLTLVPPSTNVQDVRIYHWLDTYLNGGDFGPAFAQPANNPTVVGVAKDGQYEVFIQGSRAWDAYFSGVYYRPGELMELGGSLDNTLDATPTTDNGIAAQWDIPAPANPVTWTYRMATVQTNASTCGDGTITSYEGCDDGDTDDGDGCSSICQIEVGYACIGAPSYCAECFEAIDCDDGDDCTVDTCSNNTCGYSTAPQGTGCLTGFCDAAGSCVECVQDGDCGSNGFCDTETNTCACTVDVDCDDGNECTSDVCATGQCDYTALSTETLCSVGHCNGDSNAPSCICETDLDCDDQNGCTVETCVGTQCSYTLVAAGDVCESGFCSEDATPVCVECFADEQCPNDEPWCNTELDECASCLEDGHCDDDNECTLDACDGGTCSHDLRVGFACQTGGYCSDQDPVCVECVTSENCLEPQPVCTDHVCVECAADVDCSDGNECTEDTCNGQVCAHDAVAPGTDCTDGYCAGTESPACVTCADSANGALDDGCSEALPVCLVVGNGATCVVCEVAGDASGDFGCDGATPFCNDGEQARACVECRTSEDCADDATCSNDGICLHNDMDADGVVNSQDLDDDNDGIADVMEAADANDMDNDGLPNSLDRDSDGDGIADVVEAGGADADGDGVWDDFLDTNGNGLADAREGEMLPIHSDADNSPDFLDTDSDDDGIGDSIEATDMDNDGVADRSASGSDEDHDGLDAAFDSTEGGTAVNLPDRDNDGVPDYRDAQPMVIIPIDGGTESNTSDEVASGVNNSSNDPTTTENVGETTPAVTGVPTSETTTDAPPEATTTPVNVTLDTREEDSTAAASTTTDASSHVETGSPPETTDAVVDAGSDAGTAIDVAPTDDGCDCRIAGARSGRSTSSTLWLLAGLTGVLLKRRSRAS